MRYKPERALTPVFLIYLGIAILVTTQAREGIETLASLEIAVKKAVTTQAREGIETSSQSAAL